MHSKSSAIAASLLALVVTIACGDNKSPIQPTAAPTGDQGPAPAPNPTPTPTPTPEPAPSPAPTPEPAPSPAPTPAPSPAPTPTPDAPMVFTPDAASPASHSFSLQPADTTGDDLYVALYANDFGGVNGVNTINMVRATISYDPSVVELVSFSSAESWLESFGYGASFSVSKSGGNLIKVRVDSKDSFDGASGSGRILRLRFRRIAAGSSRLEFVEAHAYGASYNDNLQATHGGTLVVK
jgi:hypothetical protein